MGHSRHPGSAGRHHRQAVVPARTPGHLGHLDAAQPDYFALQGDTFGPLGTGGDSSALQGVCRAPNSFDYRWSVHASVVPPAPAQKGEDKDTELWVFSRKAFIQAMSTVAAYASPAKDARTWAKLWADFGLKGKYYIKSVEGSDYIIFKGYAGLRKTITGTRYLAENPKVLSMAIGRSGVVRSGIEGGVLSIVLVGAADVIEFILRDDETLSEFGVKLFSDLTKTMIATAIATAAAAVVAALGVPIIVPLAISIGLGIVASKGLDWLDDQFQLTKKLQAWVERSNSMISQVLDDAKSRLNEAGRRAADMVRLLITLKRDYDRLSDEFEKLRRMLSYPIPNF